MIDNDHQKCDKLEMSAMLLRICNGDRPEISDSEAPKCYIYLMKKCWDSDPNNRPKIAEVRDLIKSFTYNEEFNRKEYERKNINDDQSTHLQAIYTSRLLSSYTKNLLDDCNTKNLLDDCNTKNLSDNCNTNNLSK